MQQLHNCNMNTIHDNSFIRFCKVKVLNTWIVTYWVFEIELCQLSVNLESIFILKSQSHGQELSESVIMPTIQSNRIWGDHLSIVINYRTDKECRDEKAFCCIWDEDFLRLIQLAGQCDDCSDIEFKMP